MSSKMGILLNRLWAGHNISLNEVRGVKKKKCVSKLDISFLVEEEERDVCGFPRWLATVQTDATIR